jgi:hypothetical protein
VNRKRVLRVMRERGLLVRSRRLRARRKKEWGRVEAAEPNQIWQSDMTKIWAGPAVGWAYLARSAPESCLLLLLVSRSNVVDNRALVVFWLGIDVPFWQRHVEVAEIGFADHDVR